jgi:hypothetical protein
MAHFMKQGFSLLGWRQPYLDGDLPRFVVTKTVLAVSRRSIGTVNFIHRPTAKFSSKESAIVPLEKFLQIHSVSPITCLLSDACEMFIFYYGVLEAQSRLSRLTSETRMRAGPHEASQKPAVLLAIFACRTQLRRFLFAVAFGLRGRKFGWVDSLFCGG